MTPWEEVRSESNPMPPRGSPLPWMLLAVSLALTVGVIVVGNTRLGEERQRTAAALKANDDVQAKLRSALSEKARLEDDLKQSDDSAQALSTRIVTLELQIRALEEELAAYKSRGAPKR